MSFLSGELSTFLYRRYYRPQTPPSCNFCFPHGKFSADFKLTLLILSWLVSFGVELSPSSPPLGLDIEDFVAQTQRMGKGKGRKDFRLRLCQAQPTALASRRAKSSRWLLLLLPGIPPVCVSSNGFRKRLSQVGEQKALLATRPPFLSEWVLTTRWCVPLSGQKIWLLLSARYLPVALSCPILRPVLPFVN